MCRGCYGVLLPGGGGDYRSKKVSYISMDLDKRDFPGIDCEISCERIFLQGVLDLYC